MKLIFIFATVVTLAIAINAEICQLDCTDSYDPICACRGKDCETFGNDCYLNRRNCGQSPEFWYIYQYGGECDSSEEKEKDKKKSGEEKGKDKRKSTEEEYNSSSQSSEESKLFCNLYCDELYSPVCGCTREGYCQTFPNDCYLNRENCEKTPECKYVKKYDGECDSSEQKEEVKGKPKCSGKKDKDRKKSSEENSSSYENNAGEIGAEM